MQRTACERGLRVKILFYIHALAGGGAERVWALLASALAERGHEVTFATDWDTRENAAFIHPKIKLVVLGGNHLQSTWRLSRLIRQEKPDATLSGISVSNLKHTLAALLAGRLSRSILSYHGYYESEPQLLSRIGYIATPVLTRLAARTVCVSEGMRRHVLGFRAPAQKLTRIYNPSVLDTIAPISAETPMSEREPLIISVGRLVEYKQTAMLVRAFARMRYPGAKLAILGEGPERPAIEAEIARLGLTDRITMVGYENAPWIWYAKAKVLALTSRSESFGLVVVEALSRGLQVVSTDTDGPREILEGGRHGTLVPTDSEHALAEALDEALRYPRDTAPGMLRALDFSTQKAVDSYEALIATTAGIDLNAGKLKSTQGQAGIAPAASEGLKAETAPS